MIDQGRLPGRAVARPRDAASTWTCSPSRSRCSPCPTATSDCAATSTRASPTACPAPTSTRSTRPRPLPYAEAGYGYPEDGQTLVDVTNGKIIRLLVDDEPFDVRYGELLEHERMLDLRAGTLRATARWRSPAGKQVTLRSTRLVSLAQRGVAAIEYVVEARRRVRPGHRAVRAGGQRGPARRSKRPARGRRAAAPAGGGARTSAPRTARCCMHRTRAQRPDDGRRHGPRVDVPGRVEVDTDCAADDLARTTVICGLRPGQQLRIVKYLAYGWSSLRSRPALRDQVAGALAGARYTGWQGLLDAQRAYLDDFWDGADVEVEGDPESSRRCGSACSTSCRPAPAPSAGPSPARG